ncbi:hypothetical protein Tco_0327105 [Tanacetum coccineum]
MIQPEPEDLPVLVRGFACFPLLKVGGLFFLSTFTLGCFFSFWNRVIFGSIPIGACEVEISSWRGARVDVRTYLLGGAIDGSEANGIIRDPKLELESSRFTFDLVHLSYESVDVVVGESGVEDIRMSWYANEKVLKMPGVNKVRLVRMVTCCGKRLYCLVGRKLKFTDNAAFGLTMPQLVFMGLREESLKEDNMYVKFSNNVEAEQRGRLLDVEASQRVMSDLHLPEGADDFIVYYDARSKDLEACLEKGRSEFDFEAKCYMGKANVDVAPWSEAKNEFEVDVRRSDLGRLNQWLSMKKDIASCGSKYLAYSEVEVKYQGSSGLLLQPELPE